MKTVFSLVIATIFLVTACGVVKKGDPLTDAQVLAYIKVYTELRKAGPSFLEKINQDPENPLNGQAGFNDFEKIIKQNGLKDYQEFVILNAKIGALFSIMQGEQAMSMYENMTESGSAMMDAGIAGFQKIIDNPDMPEETKQSARESIEELRKGKNDINDNWAKNKPWADFVLDKTKKISGLIVHDQDIQMVKKYEKEIMEAYTGFPMPELPDGRFPELNFSE